MELAAACDLRLVDRTLVAGMPEVRVGVPSVIEACLLPRLIGWGAAADLVLTGRTMDAAEAQRLGFVQALVHADALDGAVDARLSAILSAEPAAIRAQKAVLRGWEAEDGPAIEASIEAFARTCGTGAPTRAIAALRKAR
jgi:enoyl-CoA hydratase/carnithine racemase